MDLVLKPPGIQAGQLRVRQVPVAWHDHDLGAVIPRDVRPIAQLFPAHFPFGLDENRIDQDVLVPMPLQHRDHLQAESHLRRPKSLKMLAPQQMATQPKPPFGLRIPIGYRR